MNRMSGAAFFVGLFLILAVSFASLPSATVGIPIRLAGLPYGGGDCRPVVVQVVQDGWVRLFGETLRAPQLPARLKQIFRTRSDFVVFVTAASDLPYAEVMAVIDAIVKDDYTVALITPAVDRCCCPSVLGYNWAKEQADRERRGR